jgi:hypothetical protein
VPLQALNDAEIRELLLPFVHDEHDKSPTLLIEEFAIYGGIHRADLAALNGVSHGYEIKSDRDTLVRLPQQVSAYGAIFERATLVSTERHLSSARKIIPKWWGIVEAKQTKASRIRLERIREARPNPAPHAESIAALLWRSEALRILTDLGLDHGVRSKPMEHLVERLANEIPIEKLSNHVREAVRARGDWRAAARLRRCDGKFLLPANRSSYQRTPYGHIYR